MKGRVVKGLGGLYEVETENERIVCRARGHLKRGENEFEDKVLIGDHVSVECPDGDYVISDILPRRNSLIRPPMANLDVLYCVIACVKPEPSLETLDKLTAISVNKGIRTALVITKTDCDPEAAKRYADIYMAVGVPVFPISSVTGEGIDALAKDLASSIEGGKTAAFAGASGVGKSTLLNSLLPGISLETGEISKRVERGKHTTRHVELFRYLGGYVSDTPGFSMLDFARFDFFRLDELFDAFPEFVPFRGKCKFGDCTHTGEGPADCAIASAVKDGIIPISRHESYRNLYKTLKSKPDWERN